MFLDAVREMLQLFQMTMADCRYWLLCIPALLFLCFSGKKEREGIVIPFVFFLVIVFNPIVYALFWKRFSYSNWRLFWMIPMAGVICLAGVKALSRFRTAARIPAGILVIAALIFSGSSVYRTYGAGFGAASDAFKLPEEAAAVAHILLEQEAEPRAVVSDGINCYVRQYSSDIHMMYGRDSQGYIHAIDEDSRHVHELLDEDSPDFAAVHREMKRMKYSYLVLWNHGRFSDDGMLRYGFEAIGEAGIYTVYRLTDLPEGTTGDV